MAMDPLNLNRLVYFAAVAECGSFTAAAERLGITKSVVSQQVSRLEAELGTTLLLRSTRRTEMTDAGRLLQAQCSVILRDVAEVFEELGRHMVEPAGLLRIAAPNDFGTAVVVPAIAAFRSQFPQCQVELVLGDQTLDLVANRIDIALRVGWLQDSSLQTRRVGSFSQVAVASEQLLDGRAVDTPDDLSKLPFVANTVLADPLSWTFSRDGCSPTEVTFEAAVCIDATPAVLAAVLAGCGFSIVPDFLVRQELQDGRLKSLVPQWKLPVGGIHVVYPPARFRPAKVTSFAKILAATMADWSRSPR